jgi:DNA-binding transcriptional LysR family regulator
MGFFQLILCASPAYLQRHGIPETPRDLDRHHAIRFRFPNSGRLQEWPLIGNHEWPPARIALTCNNMEALRGATIAGLGIGCMPDFLVSEPIADGRLKTVLGNHIDGPARFRMLWPSNRHLSPKVRVFVDFMTERLFAKMERPTLNSS